MAYKKPILSDIILFTPQQYSIIKLTMMHVLIVAVVVGMSSSEALLLTQSSNAWLKALVR